MTSQTVKNIVDQVNSIRGMHPSTTLMVVDESTLRVHSKRGRNIRNVDIRYELGADLYTVEVHTFNSRDYDVTTVVTEGVYSDQLPAFFPDRVVLHSS